MTDTGHGDGARAVSRYVWAATCACGWLGAGSDEASVRTLVREHRRMWRGLHAPVMVHHERGLHDWYPDGEVGLYCEACGVEYTGQVGRDECPWAAWILDRGRVR